jgi:hypothetical protein
LVSGIFLTFSLTDTRPPDDHDDFYTASSAQSFVHLDAAPLGDKLAVLAHHFGQGDLHPRGPQTVLLIAMDVLGASQAVYRSANLPFLLLLVLGTLLLARQLLSERAALLAAFV